MDIFNEVVGRHMGGQLIPVTRFGSTMQTFTPQWVVKDMIELLPDQVWNEHTTFLDISCKTGIFLVEIFKKLDEVLSKNPKYVDTATRRSHILNEQLYGLALDDKECLWYSSRNVYGRIGAKNMKYLHAGSYSYDQLVKNKKVEYMKALIQEEFGRNMFDVVVGNPPYNNDMYIPFIELGHTLADKCGVFITPAKWQAKGGQVNERFRKNIVPYMKNIVMYKDSTDVFAIEEWGGITYYLLTKDRHDFKQVKNICNTNKAFSSPIEIHNEIELKLMPNSIKRLTDKLSYGARLGDSCNFSRFTYTSEQERGHKYIDGGDNIAIVQGTKYTGGFLEKTELKTTDKLDKYKVITSCMWGNGNATFDNNSKVLGVTNLSIVKPNEVPKGSFIILKYFDTEDQCRSFISFMYSKPIAFCIYLGLIGATLNKEFWRFVPDPGAFDHIFTDQELYKKYNLTDEEINIIESVIKERK